MVQTLTPTRTGTTWTATATTLPQGAYTAQVRQADSAGNAGLSSGVAFTVDTAGPVPSITAPAAASSTNSATPTLSGTAGTAGGDLATITVRVYSGASTAGTLLQTRTATASAGAWSVAATTLPSNGQYTVQATQSDAAGNAGTSAAVTFTYDTVAPAVPTVTAPSTWVTTLTPTITGTAANGTGDNTTVTVEILSGATVVQTLAAPRSGTTWSIVVPTALTEGAAYTVRARQGDAAGNTSANSAALGFTVDTLAPAVTLTTPANPAYTNVTTPALSGAAGNATGDSTTVTVKIYNAGGTLLQTLTPTRTGATWSATAAALAQGTYTAQASQTDSAGNVGTSTTNTFTVDTTRPTATSISAAGGTLGRIETGDVVTFTYSEAIAPASVLAGFTGAATPVRVRVANSGNKDVMTILDGSGAANVRLATQVTLSANFVTATTTWAATMTQSADQKSFVITLGAPDVAGTTKTVGASKNMVWSFAGAVTDLAGNAILAGNYTENVADTDF